MGTVWYVLEKATDYERFVAVKLIEASFKADVAAGTNDPVRFHTPAGKEYWTSADWLLAPKLAIHAGRTGGLSRAAFDGCDQIEVVSGERLTALLTGRPLAFKGMGV